MHSPLCSTKLSRHSHSAFYRSLRDLTLRTANTLFSFCLSYDQDLRYVLLLPLQRNTSYGSGGEGHSLKAAWQYCTYVINEKGYTTCIATPYHHLTSLNRSNILLSVAFFTSAQLTLNLPASYFCFPLNTYNLLCQYPSTNRPSFLCFSSNSLHHSQ